MIRNAQIILVSFLMFGCSPSYYTKISKPDSSNMIADDQPQYDNVNYWAAHPDKWDPSDSISLAVKDRTRDTSIDIFFLHPTTLTSKFHGNFNGQFSDDTLNAKTDYSSILYQASVFNSQANIFAPRYRQAHIQMYYYPDTTRALESFELAYQDVKKAFLHYVRLNRNKPFIIAGHSQGTQHAKRLISECIDGKALQDKLVMAYLIGMPVVDGSFKKINPCKDSTQTGCYVSWRTFRENFEGPEYLKKEKPVTVTNPLNWRTDSALADRSLHKGAVLMNYNKKIPAPSYAMVHRNILWVSRPKFPGSALYTSKNYHVGDYNLFYFNIREDVIRRIKFYKEQH